MDLSLQQNCEQDSQRNLPYKNKNPGKYLFTYMHMHVSMQNVCVCYFKYVYDYTGKKVMMIFRGQKQRESTNSKGKLTPEPVLALRSTCQAPRI